MKKESMQEVLNQMTPKQLEGLRFLTESGRLEDLVKDLVANLELTTTSKSTKKLFLFNHILIHFQLVPIVLTGRQKH